jgi:hypothetical protein
VTAKAYFFLPLAGNPAALGVNQPKTFIANMAITGSTKMRSAEQASSCGMV